MCEPSVLTEAVLAGAGRILRVRCEALTTLRSLAVRTSSQRVPVWDVWKQPVIMAPSARIADRVLRIAGV
jgi:hypothetical protein